MAEKRRIWHYLIAVLILVVLVIVGIKVHKKRIAEISDIPAEPAAPWALHFVKVNANPVDSGFPALAMVSTREELTIMPRISGRILKMGPREGVRVKAGELLVSIDTREIEDTINSLKSKHVSAMAEAKRDHDEFKREKELLLNGGSNASAVEARHTAFVAATQQVNSLEHQIKSLMVRRGYGKIRASADGIIAKRLAEPGDMAVPSRPLYKITASNGAIARAELPQSIMQKVHIGTPMELYYNNKKAVFPVTRIFPTVDARALGIVEADFDKIPFDLPSGARVACRIILDRLTDILQVPYGSLLCGAGQNRCSLFKLAIQDKKNILRKIHVAVKLRGHEGVAIQVEQKNDAAASTNELNGDTAKIGDKGHLILKAGDMVVVAHESVLLQLKDGDPVVVAKGDLP